MIFETLNESAERGELILIEGGLCHFHQRRDGQVTIREILVLPEHRGLDKGQVMLGEVLYRCPDATSLFAKCPADLPANGWYERMGFVCEGIETTRTGRELKLWRMKLPR